MTLQIAEAIAEFLPQPVETAASELIVLELYRQGRISCGKAAELLAETLEKLSVSRSPCRNPLL